MNVSERPFIPNLQWVSKHKEWLPRADVCHLHEKKMDNENGAGISFLFAKLCEVSFKQEAGRNFDIYRRPRFSNSKREALKLCLYETLFDELRAPWVGETTRPKQKCIKDLDENSPFCTKDKLAIAAFRLRLARRYDDADKLDELVCQWSKCAGKCTIKIYLDW